MDAETLTQLINGVGFPIVACGALFWLNVNVMRQQRQTLAAIEGALSSNTKAITELSAKIQR